jgi:phospholipid/cholesterol/gamma-HCH transport system permease protein
MEQLRIERDGDTLRVRGPLTADTAAALWRALEAPTARGGEVVVDLSGVSLLGTAGAAVLAEGSARAHAAGGSVRIAALRPEHEEVLEHVVVAPPRPRRRSPPFLERLGASAHGAGGDLSRALRLVGRAGWLAVCSFRRGPRGRVAETLRQLVRIGSDGVPVVVTIALLLGLALAFQAAYQLRQFGASIFVANLVALSVLRELGPVMTAVVVIGRSGSAIAAELGTMVVREEVDALKVMGVDPLQYLVVPRLYAMTVAVPALTVFANIAGILGGLVIGVAYLDISAQAYVNQTLRYVVAGDLLVGMFKSVLFAWVICFVAVAYGLAPKAGPDTVGRATTASVVTSIFLLVVVDTVVTTLHTIWLT